MCAFALDGLPADKLKHWVRNVAQHRDAFRLPLAQGHFYPDFVAELADERLFVVEYKGDGFTTTDDTREKVAVGELWEQAMGGKGLFLLVERNVKGKDAARRCWTRSAEAAPAKIFLNHMANMAF
jgi:type III restriction enzyme